MLSNIGNGRITDQRFTLSFMEEQQWNVAAEVGTTKSKSFITHAVAFAVLFLPHVPDHEIVF